MAISVKAIAARLTPEVRQILEASRADILAMLPAHRTLLVFPSAQTIAERFWEPVMDCWLPRIVLLALARGIAHFEAWLQPLKADLEHWARKDPTGVVARLVTEFEAAFALAREEVPEAAQLPAPAKWPS